MDRTVCDAPVPGDRIRQLARREDLTFLEIRCDTCGSTALGFVADDHLPEGARPETAAGIIASPEAVPITSDEVLAMHELLAGWQGDLRSLVGGPGPS